MRFNKRAEETGDQRFSPSRQPTINPAPANKTTFLQHNPNSSPTRALIDACLNIHGNLETEGEVQVDGRINGNIRCAHLTVGRDAIIIGDITAEEVVVRGKVTGVIRGNRVILQEGAHVESEIFQNKLTIEEGACFKGMIRDQGDSKKIDETEAHVGALQEMATEMKSSAVALNEKDETRIKRSLAG